jgi:adenylate cyclase
MHKQAWKESLRLTESSLRKAEQIGNDLIAMNPNDASGYQILTFSRGMLREIGARAADDESLQEDLAMAERALSLEPENERSNFVYANALFQAGRHTEAIAFASRTLEINPSFSLAFAVRGVAHVAAGHVEEAIRDSETAIRLNPRDPTNFYRYGVMGEAHYLAGNHEKARHWATQCATARPDWWYPYIFLIATAQQAGDARAANASLARLQATLPGATVAKVRTYLYGGAVVKTPLLNLLLEAGLPE